MEKNPIPWRHGIGIDVSDCKSFQEVLEKAGLNYQVDKCDLVAKMPIKLDGRNNTVNKIAGEFIHDSCIYRDCPKGFATYRTDENICLGAVQDKYTVVQNNEAFSFFDPVIKAGKATFDTAGYFGRGERIYITAKISEEEVTPGDAIENYLVFSNSHDGSSSVDIMFTPLRVKCNNMVAAGISIASSHISFKHTKSVGDNLRKTSMLMQTSVAAGYNQLLLKKMTDDEVMKYFLKVNCTEEEYSKAINIPYAYKKIFILDHTTLTETGISTKKANDLKRLLEYYYSGVAQKEIVGTAYGAYNAVTGHLTNNNDSEGETKVRRMLYGTGQSKIYSAFNTIIRMDEYLKAS